MERGLKTVLVFEEKGVVYIKVREKTKNYIAESEERCIASGVHIYFNDNYVGYIKGSFVTVDVADIKV